jgi:hypothetical protein
MLCGMRPTVPVPVYINNSGFGVVDSLNILGFKITKNWEDLHENLNKAEANVDKQIRFWDRYRLSLPGRINVAKTLLLPQLSYHASIIPLCVDKLDSIQEKINDFITGKLRIAKNLITAPVELGGLGFFDLKIFIMSLQCAWIKRTTSSIIDNWRLNIHLNTGGNPLTISPRDFVQDTNPLSHTIATSFFKFKESFFLRNDNFYESSLLGNPCLIDSEKNWLQDDIWLTNEEDQLLKKFLISDIKIKDLIDINGAVKPRRVISEILSSDISVPVYNEITAAMDRSKKFVRQKKVTIPYPESSDIGLFLKKFKKGSKPIRKIFEQCKNAKIKLRSATRTKTFFKLIEIPIPNDELLMSINKEWSHTCYSVKLREFIFKFRNNILGLNTRVSNFNNNINRSCTFCAVNQQGPQGEETFLHLFYECTHSKKCIDNFMLKYLPELNLPDHLTKKNFLFLGINPDSRKRDNFFVSTIAISIMRFIWECKLQKHIPVAESLANDIFFNIESIRRASSTLKMSMNLDLSLCRNWSAEISRRH